MLAAALAGQGRYGQVTSLYEQAMATCQAARPPREYEVAVHLHGLAAIHHSSGRAVEAERCYRSALDRKFRLLGAEQPDIALVVNNLATLLDEQCRGREAKSYYRQALAIAVQTLPPDHPVVTAIHDNLVGRGMGSKRGER